MEIINSPLAPQLVPEDLGIASDKAELNFYNTGVLASIKGYTEAYETNFVDFIGSFFLEAWRCHLHCARYDGKAQRILAARDWVTAHAIFCPRFNTPHPTVL